MLKRFCSFLTLLSFVFTSFFCVWANAVESTGSSEYKKKVDACFEAIDKLKQKEITDYICSMPKSFTKHDVAYQVIMDLEMKKVDSQIMIALDEAGNMEPSASNIDIVASWFDERDVLEFFDQYKRVCEDLHTPTSVLYNTIQSYWSVSADSLTSSFIPLSQGRCMNLVDRKMHAFRDTAMLLLARSFSLSYARSKNSFMRAVKKRYELLINKLTVFVWQLSRIEQKYSNVTSGSNGGTQ